MLHVIFASSKSPQTHFVHLLKKQGSVELWQVVYVQCKCKWVWGACLKWLSHDWTFKENALSQDRNVNMRHSYLDTLNKGFPGGANGKEPACQFRRHETGVWSLDWEDPLEEGIATYSSVLAWRIPRTEELVGYSSWGHRVRQDWAHTHSHPFLFSLEIHVLCNMALQLLPSPGRIRISSPWTRTSLASAKRRKQKWALPSGPVAKTPSTQCRRLVFDPRSEN